MFKLSVFFKSSFKILTFLLSFLPFGHLLTDVGRRAWHLVFWKFWRFLLLCFGYWTEDAESMYKIHQVVFLSSTVWADPNVLLRLNKMGKLE